MVRFPRTALFPLLLIPLLAACASTSGNAWFEEQCRDKGLAPGSAAFTTCVQETKAWVEWTQWRNEHVGKGP